MCSTIFNTLHVITVERIGLRLDYGWTCILQPAYFKLNWKKRYRVLCWITRQELILRFFWTHDLFGVVRIMASAGARANKGIWGQGQSPWSGVQGDEVLLRPLELTKFCISCYITISHYRLKSLRTDYLTPVFIAKVCLIKRQDICRSIDSVRAAHRFKKWGTISLAPLGKKILTPHP